MVVNLDTSLNNIRQYESAILMAKRELAINNPSALMGVFGYCEATVNALKTMTDTDILNLMKAENKLPLLTLRSTKDGFKRLLSALPKSPLANLEFNRLTVN